MKKPQELREFLLQSVPGLANNPDQLQIFIDSGTLKAGLKTSLHYQYEYKLNIVLTDFGLHPDSVIVPLLAWLKINQIDLAPDAVKFQADIIDKGKIDLSIYIPLDERVLVTQDETGNYQTEHLAEPETEYNQPDPILFTTLHSADGEQLTPEPGNG